MSLEDRRRAFLEEINRNLPEGVDWKRGASDYLKRLGREEARQHEIYHLIKPFLGGPDFEPFFAEMYGFLNILQHVDLPMRSAVMDVACGPGWTAHYLAKLGYRALGIDISPEMVETATRRIAADPFPTYAEIPLSASFMVHDIERGPICTDTLFDAAIFESALHHFYDPVAAIENVSQSLRQEGILCVWEGAAPSLGSADHRRNVEIMKRHQTLERPYTRRQVLELLDLCGYSHREFYSQVNGLFNPGRRSDMRRLNQQLSGGRDWNLFVASRSSEFFRRKSRMPTRRDGLWNLWRLLRIKDQREFLVTLYAELLSREPDAEGLAHYLGRSDSLLSRLRIIRAFRNSQEHSDLRRGSTS